MVVEEEEEGCPNWEEGVGLRLPAEVVVEVVVVGLQYMEEGELEDMLLSPHLAEVKEEAAAVGVVSRCLAKSDPGVALLGQEEMEEVLRQAEVVGVVLLPQA